MIINRQIGGSGGEAASIFITGLSETDTVTCTKDGKVKQGKWVSKTNPAVSVPAGYTQLEYIESSGTQYIDTNVKPTGSMDFEVTAYVQSSAKQGTLFGGGDNYNSKYLGVSINQAEADESDIRYDSQRYKFTLSSEKFTISKVSNKLLLDNVELATCSAITFTSDYPIRLFAYNRGESIGEKIAAKLYGLKFSDNGSAVANFIPAKRNSDGVIGMYDLVSKSFLTNAGTGTFVAGAELPSVISGWLLDKLKEYGTYTIIATNDTDTVTQDVLVDMATEFDIEMSYIKDKLLTSDDFQNGTFKNGTHSILTNQENGTDGIRLVGTASRVYNNPSLDAFIRLDMTIDFTGYSKLKFKMKKVVNHGIMLVVVTDGLKNTSKSWDDALGYTPSSTYTEPLTVAYVGVTKNYKELTANVWNDCEIDVSNVTGEHVLTFVGGYTDSTGYSTSETHYCDIWLMK